MSGRKVYDAQRCARCHSIGGRGSPRSPLDGVGARLSREDLRAWVVGDEPAASSLPSRTTATKRAFERIPEGEMRVLLDYLQSLGR